MDRLPDPDRLVILGIDTHAEVHVAAALDGRGQLLATLQFRPDTSGFMHLVEWANEFGTIDRVGIEGTGSYGAPLTRWLRHEGFAVVEVNRPDRSTRRHRGKSDPIDAESAARAVLAGTATAVPKSGDGNVECIRVLRVVRDSAVKARTQAANQLHALVVTAPESLREELHALTLRRLVATVSRFRLRAQPATPRDAYKQAMHVLGRRWHQLTNEITACDRELERLVAIAAPNLVAIHGVGTHTAATLLITAGDNPERLRNEGAFAQLCGVAPLPASSGKTVRHRLNRGGDRAANNALWIITIGRMARDAKTRDYVNRRTTEGKTKKEIIRCLKRYIAREIFPVLTATATAT